MSEWMLRDVAAASPMRYVVLRYFNVAGSDPDRPHRPVDAKGAPCWSRSPARRRWASARTCRSSARTTPRRTARACATTSTSKTWPRPTSMPSSYLRDGGQVSHAELRLRPRLQRSRGHQERRNASAPARSLVKEEPRRAGDPPILVARADRVRSVARLEAPARRPRHHRAHVPRLGTKAPERTLSSAATAATGPPGRSAVQPARPPSESGHDTASQAATMGDHALATTQVLERLDAARSGTDRRAARRRRSSMPGCRSALLADHGPEARVREALGRAREPGACRRRSPSWSAPPACTTC